MRPLSQETRAVGAILDLVVCAVQAHTDNDPTLEDMKRHCGQACKIVASLRKSRSEGGKRVTSKRVLSPRRY